MATIAGSVKSLSSGIFHAKDENGNIRVLQEGDTIYENDTVYGDNGNSSSSKIEILLSGNDVIVLSEGQKQLIDSSLIETAFGTEELFFTREGLDLKADEHNSNADVVSDLRDAEFTNEQKDAKDEGAFTDANNSDVTKEETAEGQEEAEDETAPTGEFQARDGNATDIVSDLRNAQFKARTQVFEDKSFFENESKDRLTSPGNTDRPEYTNPPVPTPTPPTPTPPPVVTPPVIETPTVIIGNLSVNDVSSYESEGFLVFTVSLDKSVASPVTFDYVTSPITATNNGVDYTDVKGTITIPAGSTSITIKVPITDDYISDNGETMKINISNVVGNANISKPQGIGTILDNPVNNPSNGTTETPTEPGGYGQEDTVYAIITGATTVNEGNTTTYTVKLVDKDGNAVVVTNPTTVTVKYTNVTTQDGDTEYNNNNTINVTIPANGSSNTFTVESIDDYFADNGEKYNVAITKVDTNEFENVVIGDKNGNNKNVTTTILDNPSTTEQPTIPTDPSNPNNPDDGINYGQEDTVYAIITGATTVNEGNTTTYTVKLVDKDGNAVVVTNPTTVTVKYTNVTTQDGDTEYNNNNTINVTIPANGSSNTFTVESIDDYFADNGEKYNVAITKVDTNEFENVVIGDKNGNNKDVTTTILDDTDNTPNNPNDGVEANHESVIIKLVACDASGNPILEADGKTYKIVNEVNEGDNAKYMALAFEPNSTTFTTETKLSLQGGTVTVDTSNGTAIGVISQTKEDGSEDFILVKDKVVNIGVAFEVVTVDDYISDNNEIYTVSINSGSYTHPTTPIYENVTINTEAVTTTINDNSTNQTTETNVDSVKIVLVATDSSGTIPLDGDGKVDLTKNTNETPESGKLYYVAVAIDSEGKPLSTQDGTVDVTYGTTAEGTDKDATAGTDYDNTTVTNVNIGEVFEVQTNDDYFAEGDENFTVTITNQTGTSYESPSIDTNNDTVTSTIKDNPANKDTSNPTTPTEPTSPSDTTPKYGEEDSVYVVITENPSVVEGQDLVHNLKLVDKDGNEVKIPTGETVTVTLKYTSITGTINDSDFSNTRLVTVILNSDGKATITNTSVVDNIVEGSEKYTLTIDKITQNVGTFENIVVGDTKGDGKSVTGEIVDNEVKIVLVAVTEADKDKTGDALKSAITKIDGTVDLDKNTNQTPEGGKLYYVPVAIDSNGKPLDVQAGTVDLTYGITSDTSDKDATAGTDYVNTKTTATIGTVFSVDAKDDYYAEGDEKFEVTISNPDSTAKTTYGNTVSVSTQKTVTSTIKDNPANKDTNTPTTPTEPTSPSDTTPKYGEEDSVYVVITENPSVVEGEDLVHNLKLVDKDGNEVKIPAGETVTVTLKYTSTTGTVNDSDFSNTRLVTVTLDSDGKATITNKSVVDNIVEGDEKYTLTIDKITQDKGTFENIEAGYSQSYKGNHSGEDGKSVTGTIKDNVVNIVLVAVTEADKDKTGDDLKTAITKADGTVDLTKNINQTPEGGKLYYVPVAIDSNGKPLDIQAGTVDLTYGITSDTSDKDATAGTDYDSTKTTATIGTVFSVDAKDDYYAEGNEKFEVTISTPDSTAKSTYGDTVSVSTQKTVTSTITDNPANINKPDDNTGTDNPTNGSYGQEDTVYAIITGTQTIKEGDTSTNYTVKLVDKDGNTVTPTKDTKITVTYNHYTDGKPTQDDDTQYNNGDTIEVTILANTSEITFTVETKDDVYKDDGEQFNLTITDIQNTGEFENVKIGDKDGNQKNVISTIKDNTTPGTETNIDDVKIVLVAVPSETTTIANITDGDGKLIITNTNETPESGKLYYIAVAVDSEGKPLTQSGQVTVNTTDDTAKGGNSVTPPLDGSEDYSSLVNKTVNIGEVFEVQTNDDYIRDNNEKFTVKITNPVNTDYESPSIDTSKDTVTSTIKDNPAKVEQPDTGTGNDNPTDGNYGKDDTVYVKITQAPSTIEGGNLVHTVTLVDKNGDPVTVPAGQSVTVTLEYTAKSSTGTGTFTEGDLSTIVKTVTIDGGTNHKDFTNISIDDFTAEGDEVYTVTITDVSQTGAFENVAISSTNSTTGTIKDGVILGTPVNAKVDEDNFVITDIKPQISKSENLGITTPNTDEDYTLSFDNTIKVFKGDATSSETNIYGDSTGLKSGGVLITYEVNGDTITGKAGSETVFTITLNKNAAGGSDDNYTYTQYKNIDHPVSGPVTNNVNDDDITFEFGFNITDQNQTSSTQTFKVTVNDSMPVSGTKEVAVVEDSLSTTAANTFIISQENFKDGKIEISNDGGSTWKTLTQDGTGDGKTIDIKDPNDATKTVGTLTNNGDGTVTFVPIEDYSNYNAKPTFSYKVFDNDGDYAEGIVNITVKPVADAPTIEVADVVSYEDASTYSDSTTGNAAEGGNKIPLGLKIPDLSKDTIDENTTHTGDKPEKNGEITLTFTNGDKVAGAKIFIGNEASASSTITSNNQELKIVIVKTSGGTDIDRDYHHADVTTGQANTLYLTKAEYESLKIQHAEDNDTDIKIKISVTSYEVDDTNKPLDTNTYGSQVENETTADMTVKINPVTDDIKLEFDDNTVISGTISSTDSANDTFTFTNKITEGSVEIKLNDILSNTSGGIGVTPDLDGSEKRTYIIEGVPEGTIIKIGDTEAVADKDGKATLTFKDAENKLLDPQFSIKFPEHFGGGVEAKITLSVYDKGVDSDDIAGQKIEKTVYLNLDVEPVATTATINTIQVSQAIGYEDAGRSKGNTENPSSTIDEPQKGIPLNIKVTSDDDDGSETANIKIGDIPNGSALYVFDNSLNSGAGAWVLVDKDFVTSGNISVTSDTGKYTVEIKDYQNDKAPKFIPPYNDDIDYKLKVSVQFEDTVTYNDNSTGTKTSDYSDTKDIDVIVKNVADAPVGTDIQGSGSNNEYTVTTHATEDTLYNLKDIYTTPADLKSSDNSEDLTVRIKFPDNSGIILDEGSPYYIDNGEYVVKASDIQNGDIKIKLPENFSGNASFDLTYVTTEKAGENDSKTWHTDKINIFVNPIAEAELNKSSAGNEDEIFKVNLSIAYKDGDTDETLEVVKIKAADVTGKDFTLYIGNSTSTALTTLTPVDGYYVLTAEEANNIYAKNTIDNTYGDYNFEVKYSVKDSAGTVYDTKEDTFNYDLKINAVTDAPDIQVTQTTTTTPSNVTITNSGKTIDVLADNTDFTVKVNTTSDDKDSSEEVQRIEIYGVPKGVTVENATYMGSSGDDYGVWIINNPAEKSLDSDGADTDIKFIIHTGADFTGRDITIKTYTKDVNASEESDFINIRLNDFTNTNGSGSDTTPDFKLEAKNPDVEEDKPLTLNDLYDVTYTTGNVTGSNWAATFTDLPVGTKVEGKNGVNIFTYENSGKTYYVVSGSGQQASDIQNVFKNVQITPPEDMNTGGDKNGTLTISATISSNNGSASHQGATINQDLNISPVTDEMTVNIVANSTDEDVSTPITINLSNPSDGSQTKLIGSSITIKVTETWKDDGLPSDKGELFFNGTKLVPDGNGDYNISIPNGYVIGTDISGLEYKPALNRDGDVKFEVSVQNQEGNSIVLTSNGETTIKVNPVLDMKPNVTVVTATGIEDTLTTINGTTLQNAIKLNVSTTISADSSEQFQNIILDEVPNGFTVWYKDSGNNLVMATNIGKSGTGTFDLTPNISTDSLTHENKWLVPSLTGGVLPDIYINAPSNWSGDFDFKAQFTVKEQNLSSTEKIALDVTGHIDAVADGVTIDPTLTFGDAFSWVSLNLNAKMKDVDGSETMSLELSGLGANAQFRVDGTDTLGSTQAVWDNATNKWTISGIKYDQINNIQFTNDKTVNSVGVKAWTVENDTTGTPLTGDNAYKSAEVTKDFKLDIKDVGGILSLEKDINLDFSKLDNSSLKGINEIDLGIAGENKIENLKLEDVLKLTNNSGELIIKGESNDNVTLKGNWTKGAAESGFDIYTNADDASVKVKVEQNVQDQII